MFVCTTSGTVGFGDAIHAEPAVGNEPFAVLLADDFIVNHNPITTAELVTAFNKTGKSQISVMEVGGHEISKYGVIVPKAQGLGVSGLIEKPDVNAAPSNLASIGGYVLTPDIFDILHHLPNGAGRVTTC